MCEYGLQGGFPQGPPVRSRSQRESARWSVPQAKRHLDARHDSVQAPQRTRHVTALEQMSIVETDRLLRRHREDLDEVCSVSYLRQGFELGEVPDDDVRRGEQVRVVEIAGIEGKRHHAERRPHLAEAAVPDPSFSQHADVRDFGELASEWIERTASGLLVDVDDHQGCVRNDIADESAHHREIAERLHEEHLTDGHVGTIAPDGRDESSARTDVGGKRLSRLIAAST